VNDETPEICQADQMYSKFETDFADSGPFADDWSPRVVSCLLIEFIGIKKLPESCPGISCISPVQISGTSESSQYFLDHFSSIFQAEYRISE
jgi:hypothetical protein